MIKNVINIDIEEAFKTFERYKGFVDISKNGCYDDLPKEQRNFIHMNALHGLAVIRNDLEVLSAYGVLNKISATGPLVSSDDDQPVYDAEIYFNYYKLDGKIFTRFDLLDENDKPLTNVCVRFFPERDTFMVFFEPSIIDSKYSYLVNPVKEAFLEQRIKWLEREGIDLPDIGSDLSHSDTVFEFKPTFSVDLLISLVQEVENNPRYNRPEF